MKMYLDDMRTCPNGFVLARTIEDAKELLSTGKVTHASLDHDLGACDPCMGGKTVEQWLQESGHQSMPNCGHVGTGYDLLVWMDENNHWPEVIAVHTANPAARVRMLQFIEERPKRVKERGTGPRKVVVPLAVIRRIREMMDVPDEVSNERLALEIVCRDTKFEDDEIELVIQDLEMVTLSSDMKIKCSRCNQESIIRAGEELPALHMEELRKGDIVCNMCGEIPAPSTFAEMRGR